MRVMTRLIALLGVALVLVLGTCLLDGAESPGEDLCLVVAAGMRVPELGAPRGLAGILAPESCAATPLFRLDLPAPPPKA
jgi:hypothetical protein